MENKEFFSSIVSSIVLAIILGGRQCDSQGGSRIARFRLVASAICKAAKFTQCSIEFVSHTVQSVIPAEAVYNRKT